MLRVYLSSKSPVLLLCLARIFTYKHTFYACSMNLNQVNTYKIEEENEHDHNTAVKREAFDDR